MQIQKIQKKLSFQNQAFRLDETLLLETCLGKGTGSAFKNRAVQECRTAACRPPAGPHPQKRRRSDQILPELTRSFQIRLDPTRSSHILLTSSQIQPDPTRSFQILPDYPPDPTRSAHTRSYQIILQIRPDPKKSSQILADLSRSYQVLILRDPTRHFRLLLDSSRSSKVLRNPNKSYQIRPEPI